MVTLHVLEFVFFFYFFLCLEVRITFLFFFNETIYLLFYCKIVEGLEINMCKKNFINV